MAQVNRIGDLYDVECNACGARYAYHGNPAAAPLSDDALRPVELSVKWNDGRPSHKEIQVLQSLIPAIGKLSVVQIYSLAHGLSTWSLGYQPLAHAHRLIADAAAADVKLEIVAV